MAHSIRTEKREDFEEREKVASGLLRLVVVVDCIDLTNSHSCFIIAAAPEATSAHADDLL
jgi:hypothetical protein